MSRNRDRLPARSSSREVDAFLRKVAATPVRRTGGRGRLVFALDATASREPTWDRASHIQAQMFDAVAEIGTLDVQLAWYRGYGEFRASPWLGTAEALREQMSRVRCQAGLTQIARVLGHVLAESGRERVNALVFVGDCMEEDPAELTGLAGRLGLLGVPAFLFHEGRDPVAERAFRDIARLSGGACCRFEAGAADELRDLLRAVAVFAVGGHAALEDLGRREGGITRRLATQVRRLPGSSQED